jgi:hypothetical protein
VADVTEHASLEGKVYLAVVIDAWSRRVRLPGSTQAG